PRPGRSQCELEPLGPQRRRSDLGLRPLDPTGTARADECGADGVSPTPRCHVDHPSCSDELPALGCHEDVTPERGLARAFRATTLLTRTTPVGVRDEQ